MIDKSEIAIQSSLFRNAISQCSKKMISYSFREFPLGSCGDASDMLGVFLSETRGVECDYVMGMANNQSHAWLEVGETRLTSPLTSFPEMSP
jgi:hypothetical protein